MKMIDLTGQRFGRLTAVKATDERYFGTFVWECKCDCGNITYVSTGHLRSGGVSSCGCARGRNVVGEVKYRRKPEVLTEQRYGKLTTVKPTNELKNKSVIWECKCDCGNVVYVSASDLRSARVSSCGCARGKKPTNLTDKRFGKLTAVKATDERSNGSVVWECKCDCGNTIFARATALQAGKVTSCGCAGARNLTGQRFGKLIAIKPTDERRNGSVVWECKCDCGNTAYVQANNLRSGKTTSCGCAGREDLSDQRFGMLTAINPTGERRNGHVVWECKCDCGNTAFVRAYYLKEGKTTSCGCTRGRKPVDLTGQRFGRLTAIKLSDERRNGRIVWECKCDCGSIAFVTTHDLRGGKTTSCGCASRRTPVDLTGQRFGRLIAVNPTDERRNGSVVWECKCDCGNTTYVQAGSLRSGGVTSCGCARGSDLTGQKFGLLTAIKPTDKRDNHSVVWECKCDCGNTIFVRAISLRAGYPQSCGCLKSTEERKTRCK